MTIRCEWIILAGSSLTFREVVMNENPYAPPRAPLDDRETARGIPSLDPSGLTKWLRVGLAVMALLALARVVSHWQQIQLLEQIQSGVRITHDAAAASDLRVRVLAIGDVLAYAVTAILFLRWTYVAKTNALALGTPSFEFSPGWSVGYYFVPFMNLWRPYQALRETFQASHPEFQHNLDWIEPPKLLPVWWTLWLLNNFIGQWLFRMPSAKSLPQLLNASWAHLLSAAITIPLIAVVWILVSTLQRWQAARSAAAGRHPAPSGHGAGEIGVA
jgi:hypothetical protein